ncbi:hypothetical protein G6F31_017712 [Rhizopus arrhizus]|nr:hypothetical protein G6F31_017712 [Rhizopus arrhizus]
MVAYVVVGGLARLVVFKAQEVIQRPQLGRHAGIGLAGQVVDAGMFQAVQGEDGLEARFPRRPQRRHVLQCEARTGPERAHIATPQKRLGAGLHRFHQQRRLELRMRLIQEAAVAQGLEPFQPGAVITGRIGGAGQRLARNGVLAAFVPGQHRHALDTSAAPARQRLCAGASRRLVAQGRPAGAPGRY